MALSASEMLTIIIAISPKCTRVFHLVCPRSSPPVTSFSVVAGAASSLVAPVSSSLYMNGIDGGAAEQASKLHAFTHSSAACRRRKTSANVYGLLTTNVASGRVSTVSH